MMCGLCGPVIVLMLAAALADCYVVRDGGRLETVGPGLDDSLIRHDRQGRRLGAVEEGCRPHAWHGDRACGRRGDTGQPRPMPPLVAHVRSPHAGLADAPRGCRSMEVAQQPCGAHDWARGMWRQAYEVCL